MLRKTIHLAIALFLASLAGNIIPCIAIEMVNKHHVVGGDQGWDSSSHIASWSANRNFHIGDTIWFTYAAPQEGVMELKTEAEYESCKTSNPIKMYTEGINQLPLDTGGSRYFISTNPENCEKGLKLHVKVLTAIKQTEQTTALVEAAAEGPSSSHAKYYKGWLSLVWFVLAFVLLV